MNEYLGSSCMKFSSCSFSCVNSKATFEILQKGKEGTFPIFKIKGSNNSSTDRTQNNLNLQIWGKEKKKKENLFSKEFSFEVARSEERRVGSEHARNGFPKGKRWIQILLLLHLHHLQPFAFLSSISESFVASTFNFDFLNGS